jgi:hypothetical protein
MESGVAGEVSTVEKAAPPPGMLRMGKKCGRRRSHIRRLRLEQMIPFWDSIWAVDSRSGVWDLIMDA